MAAIALSYSGLSVLALPGQLPSNIEQPSSTDTWSATDTSEVAVLVQAVSTTDTWTALFPMEFSQTDLSSANVDTWSASATEGATLLGVTLSSVDTWSATATEGTTAIAGNANAISASDTWSVAAIDTSLQTVFDFNTEMSVLCLPHFQVDAITDKTGITFNPLLTADTYAYTWTESPIDSVQVDSWDGWAASLVGETSSVNSTQDYPALDSWAAAFNESSSVLQLGPVFLNLTDTWSATFSAEVSSVAGGLLNLTDTWSASATEGASSVTVLSDSKAASDTWSASFVLESGGASSVAPVPVFSSDEWDASFVENAGLVIFGVFGKTASDSWGVTVTDDAFLGEVIIQTQLRRRIRVDGTIRHVDVE